MITWNASSVSIENPQPCVIEVYKDTPCDNTVLMILMILSTAKEVENSDNSALALYT